MMSIRGFTHTRQAHWTGFTGEDHKRSRFTNIDAATIKTKRIADLRTGGRQCHKAFNR